MPLWSPGEPDATSVRASWARTGVANSSTHHVTTTKSQSSASHYIQGGWRVCFPNTFQSPLPWPFFLAPHWPSMLLLFLGLPHAPSQNDSSPWCTCFSLCSHLGVEGLGRFLNFPPGAMVTYSKRSTTSWLSSTSRNLSTEQVITYFYIHTEEFW